MTHHAANSLTPAHGPRAADQPRPVLPADAAERNRLRTAAAAFAQARRLCPPLTLAELSTHAAEFAVASGAGAVSHAFLGVLLNNALWSPILATIPYERRILLMPQCLHDPDRCAAEQDALGLLCAQCGACDIGRLQAEAESLGYVTLVAEGTTVVTRLLEQGAADAVIGIGCLASLERTFPHLLDEGIPGLAIPLLGDGCRRTRLDPEWAIATLRLRSESSPWSGGKSELDQLRDQVSGWFTRAALEPVIVREDTTTERLALEWLCGDGKRWRPLLTAAIYRALRPEAGLPDTLRRAAIAVECFHKASLIHDDIEDGDDWRDGRPTLHRRHGVPIALNAGDFLLGEGYRLLATSGATSDAAHAMLTAAAEGHRQLCLGQGDELAWMAAPSPLSVARVTDIFARKTAPAFEVALRVGAACAGQAAALAAPLRTFSRALGIAYQIRDDFADMHRSGDAAAGTSDLLALRPAMPLAVAGETAVGADREQIEQAWTSRRLPEALAVEWPAMCRRWGVEEKVRQRLDFHKNEALRALAPIEHGPLKTLLHRLTRRILRQESGARSA